MSKAMITAFLLCLFASAVCAQDAFEWRDDFDQVQAWEAQPGWLGNPSPTAKITTAAGIAAFEVDEPQKGMKWRRDLPNIWLPEQRFLVVRYRARNMNTDRSDYFIYVDDSGRGPECSPIRLKDVKADGAWRTAAVDVLPLANGESARAVAIQVQAAAEGKAVVELDYIALADRIPEGAEDLSAAGFAAKPDVSLRIAEADWTAQPSWLPDPTEHNEVIRENELMTFRVMEPNRGMKWSCTLPEPADPAGHRYISLRYRAQDVSKRGDYTLCILGPPAKEGGPGHAPAVMPAALISDGRWHTLAVDALVPGSVIPKVTDIAFQVRAGDIPDAELQVAEVKFTNEFMPSPISDFLSFSDQVDFAGFAAADMEQACNADIGPILKRLRIAGWPENREVAVDGIPFALRQGSPNCLASKLTEKTELRIPVGAKTNEVFVLVTATYAGAEEPVYARRRDGEKLVAVRQAARFLLKLIYTDGSVEECMPLCLPTKEYEVTAGPQVLCAFADRGKQLKELALCDRMDQGSFAVSAVSCRIEGERRFNEFAEETEPLRPSPMKESSQAITRDRLAELVALKINGKEARLVSQKTSDGESVVCNFEDKAECVLRLSVRDNRESEIDINVKNLSDADLKLQLLGPRIAGIKLGERIEDNYYLYPRSGAVFHNAPASFSHRFCGDFPVQFMHIFNPKEGRGIYLRTEDMRGVLRHYVLEKTDKDMTLAVEYPEIALAPGETFAAVKTCVGATGGDWHDGFQAYRTWLRSWYPKLSPEKQWFREVFNFRQRFLWGHDPLYDREKERFVLEKAVEDAVKEFGGMDYLHIFDWGSCGHYGRIYGRTGDHPPYTIWKGGREAFASAIKGIQDRGIPVGLYIEGYLLSQKGLLGEKYGKEWQLMDRKGAGQMWPNSTEQYVCSFVPAWREVQASTYAARVKELNVNGMYLDEFGFAGERRDCWSKEHGHPAPGYVVVGERDCTRMVRERIDSVKKGVALYSEETPCDLASIYQDGSFTYTMRRASGTDTMAPLNIFRFAVPQFKTIEILVCDKATGSWAEGVKWIFFNGEAMWLEGAPEWFGEETRATIRKCYKILRTHKDAFTSLDPMPLVPTEMGGIFANRFPVAKKTVYTLYNSRHRTARGEMLRIKRRANTRYFDAWNGRDLDPRQEGEYDILSIEIGPRDVGCVVCTEE